MDSDSSSQLFHPKRLKTLASNVKYSNGNNLLHQFVLDNSDPNTSCSEGHINAVLLSMSEISANELNKEGFSALHLAVLKNNLSIAKELLDRFKNIDVNTRCCVANSALHLAIKTGYLSLIQELLNKGSDIDERNKADYTALSLAVKSGNLGLIKLLVSKGANVNLGNNTSSPLQYAAKAGNLEAVKVLVSNGADMNYKNPDQETALCHAAGAGRLTTVEFLVRNGADLNAENGWMPICHAARSGHLDVMQFLLDNGVYIDMKSEYGYCLFFRALESGDVETIIFLIENGADVNTKFGSKNEACSPFFTSTLCTTPLHCVVETGKLASVEFLVSIGADLNATDELGKTPLLCAARKGSLETVKFLVRNGADLNAKDTCGETALHYAAGSGSLETVEYLVRSGADLNAKDNYSVTPLHCAVDNENLGTTKFLVDHGADLHVTDDNRETPLYYAMQSGSLDCAEFLIDRGATLNEDNGTMLHDAVIYGPAPFTAMLIEKGADVNARDPDNGFTPLHYLLQRIERFILYDNDDEFNMDLAKMQSLLEGNADVNIKDNMGETPLCRVMRSKNYYLIKLFSGSATELKNIMDIRGITPLFYAVEYATESGVHDVVQSFLEKGADVNVRNDDDTSALPAIMLLNNSRIAKLAVERVIDLNARYKNGDTILHCACHGDNCLDIIDILLGKGSDVNAEHDFRETPLHVAAQRTNSDYTNLLLERGANAQAADIRGWTPLHFAAHRGRTDVTKTLLDEGADANAINKDGKTPVDLAEGKAYQLCIDALQKFWQY